MCKEGWCVRLGQEEAAWGWGRQSFKKRGGQAGSSGGCLKKGGAGTPLCTNCDNIFMFGSAWCQVIVQIQFSLIKKIKTGRPKHSLTPHPLRSITSHFALAPPSPPVPQSGRHMCITPNFNQYRKVLYLFRPWIFDWNSEGLYITPPLKTWR